MEDNIIFNDTEVEVEIYDAVLGKTIVTDFLETDDTKLSYLRNRNEIATKEQLEVKEVNSVTSSELIGDFAVSSLGNLQLQIFFKPSVEINGGETFLAFTILDKCVLPSFSIRFGQVWDPVSMSIVGYCSLSNFGELNIKAISTFSLNGELILLV